MQIREYQHWLETWDKARGWDRVSASHTFVHAVEELGEVARLILQLEGYKEPARQAQLHADLEEELSDVFVFLFKLAYQTGVDVEAALARGHAKAEARHFDLAKANAELARYHEQQAARVADLLAAPDHDSDE
jgi:NTP pyrophosphatase (non-canonical NTP hydrolase)